MPDLAAPDTLEPDATPDLPAAETTPPLDTATETPAEMPAGDPPPAPAPLFAGKFNTAEEAYWHSQGELNALRAQPRPAPSAPAATSPKYTTEQLWGIRAQKLQEMTAAQIAGQTEQAGTLAANVNWIDNEIQQQNLGKLRGEITGQAAVQALAVDSAELLKPYQADLVAGNPLYEQAQTYFTQMKQAIEAGIPIDNLISGLAVLAAAAKTGKHVAGTQREARAEFAGSLNKALKQAVITGAGKAAKVPDGAPDFLNMTNKQFDDHRRKIGVIH